MNSVVQLLVGSLLSLTAVVGTHTTEFVVVPCGRVPGAGLLSQSALCGQGELRVWAAVGEPLRDSAGVPGVCVHSGPFRRGWTLGSRGAAKAAGIESLEEECPGGSGPARPGQTGGHSWEPRRRSCCALFSLMTQLSVAGLACRELRVPFTGVCEDVERVRSGDTSPFTPASDGVPPASRPLPQQPLSAFCPRQGRESHTVPNLRKQTVAHTRKSRRRPSD